MQVKYIYYQNFFIVMLPSINTMTCFFSLFRKINNIEKYVYKKCSNITHALKQVSTHSHDSFIHSTAMVPYSLPLHEDRSSCLRTDSGRTDPGCLPVRRLPGPECPCRLKVLPLSRSLLMG